MNEHDLRVAMNNASHEINKILWMLEAETRMEVTRIRLVEKGERSRAVRHPRVIIQLSIGDKQ